MASCADGRSCVGPRSKKAAFANHFTCFLFLKILLLRKPDRFVEICGARRESLRTVSQQHQRLRLDRSCFAQPVDHRHREVTEDLTTIHCIFAMVLLEIRARNSTLGKPRHKPPFPSSAGLRAAGRLHPPGDRLNQQEHRGRQNPPQTRPEACSRVPQKAQCRAGKIISSRCTPSLQLLQAQRHHQALPRTAGTIVLLFALAPAMRL